MKQKVFSTRVAGVKIEAIFSDLAEQATGSVMVRYGDTVVLATAVMSREERDGDFFPLTVDFEERFYAVGKILGSQYIRREGRPADSAILAGRIVDRTMRPLFDQWIRNEVQIVLTLIALGEEDMMTAATLAASLSVAVSDIPWNGPVSAVRIGKVAGKKDLVVNPLHTERKSGLEIDLLACGKDGTVNMIEVSAREASEKSLIAALKKVSAEIEKLQSFQAKIIKEVGVAKRSMQKPETPKDMEKLFDSEIAPKLFAAIFSKSSKESTETLRDIWSALVKGHLSEIHLAQAGNYFEERVNALIHREAIENGRRADGRSMDEIPAFRRSRRRIARAPWLRHFLSRRHPHTLCRDARRPQGCADDRGHRRRRAQALYASLQLSSILDWRDR